MAENDSNSNDSDNKNELEKINDTEKKISDIHLSGKTELGKVGRDLNVTRERIKQIEAKAFEKLNRSRPDGDPPDDVA